MNKIKKPKVFAFKIDEETLSKIKDLANSEFRTIAAMIRILIRKGMGKK